MEFLAFSFLIFAFKLLTSYEVFYFFSGVTLSMRSFSTIMIMHGLFCSLLKALNMEF